MTDFEKEEFWKALGRLYDATENLRVAAVEQARVAEAHEKRLDKLDVIVQWLAQAEYRPEKGEKPEA